MESRLQQRPSRAVGHRSQGGRGRRSLGVQSQHQDAACAGHPLCQVETKWVGLGARTSLPLPARVGTYGE